MRHSHGSRSICALGRFTEPKIEPESVAHFHAAPPVTTDVRDMLACIDWIAHGFELVQSHCPRWKFRDPDTVVDDALHRSLVVGPPQSINRLGPAPNGALASYTPDLYRNGRWRESGRGSNVLGSPLAPIAHLIGVLATQREAPTLQAGERGTTGTLTSAMPIRAGEVRHTDIRGIASSGLVVALTD